MNNLTIMGNTTDAIILRDDKEANKFIGFTVALNKTINGSEYTTYVDVVVFGKMAEYVANNHKDKGRIIIEGELRNKTSEVQGKKVQGLYVVANKVKLIDFKESL